MENETEMIKRLTDNQCQSNNVSEHDSTSQRIVSDEVFFYFIVINILGPGLIVCVFGIVSNILNIITFVKQGVSYTVNISLLGLAVSDLGSQMSLLYTSISFFPSFDALDLPFIAPHIMYITAWCHIMFTRITAWITAYVTLERCICVTVPLKVKNIFTPTRTVLYLTSVHLIMAATVSPCFYTARPALIFIPTKNKSLQGLSFMENRDTIENVAFTTNNTIPTVAFILVIGCTSILVSHLRRKSKWRERAISSSNAGVVSQRDNKVVKMVVLISTIFITCYFPGAVVFIFMLLDPEMRFDGSHVNLMFTFFSILFHLESINAGVNTFIYVKLSSKFKATFMSTFCFKHKRKIHVAKK